MDPGEYNRRGKELVDYITQYLGSIRERRVLPDVKPGYMRDLLPDTAPFEPEGWDDIFADIEKIIMPGGAHMYVLSVQVVHWQSPHMHAYFPCLTSWPSLLGDMLADAINCLGFTWASSPACTELEMNVMDWLCKALGLPSFFLHHHPDSRGGGILQSTMSESTLVALLAARKHKILELRTELDQDVDDSILNSRLVAYASDQAHSSVEKAGLISLVKVRFLLSDDQLCLRGDTLLQAMEEDRRAGLVPFMVCATLGTTGVCAFDKLSEIGPICAAEGLWLHVDAAYAGTAFFCPELRWPLEGVDFADSFAFNPSKWMMVHFDCTAFWVKDKLKLQQTFSVDPLYLRHENSQVATDFMGIEMAKLLESHIRQDPNFEIPAQRHLGLVVFCLKRGNDATKELLSRLTRSGTMYLVPAELRSKIIIRFTVTSQFTTADDILRDWGIISKMATALLSEAQFKSRDGAEEENAIIKSENQPEDVPISLKGSHVELWIDKAWTKTARPTRSLSCSSEPLPYIFNNLIKPQCKDSDTTLPPPIPATSSAPMYTITESPRKEKNLLGKELKKLTKQNSVPSFCNPWVQCGRQPFCCVLKVKQDHQLHLTSSCQRINGVSANNNAPTQAPQENGTTTALLKGQ
uniref:Histidine decarboxylase n=1 Tax=Knipowitschia caucasica TaxID=637954 RepID=A0AAV2LSV3_KNICA